MTQPDITLAPITTPDRKGFAVASLTLGIISMIFWLIPILSLPMSITGLILGILARNSSRKKRAIAGIILGALATLLAIASIIISVLFVASLGGNENFMNMLQQK